MLAGTRLAIRLPISRPAEPAVQQQRSPNDDTRRRRWRSSGVSGNASKQNNQRNKERILNVKVVELLPEFNDLSFTWQFRAVLPLGNLLNSSIASANDRICNQVSVPHSPHILYNPVCTTDNNNNNNKRNAQISKKFKEYKKNVIYLKWDQTSEERLA